MIPKYRYLGTSWGKGDTGRHGRAHGGDGAAAHGREEGGLRQAGADGHGAADVGRAADDAGGHGDAVVPEGQGGREQRGRRGERREPHDPDEEPLAVLVALHAGPRPSRAAPRYPPPPPAKVMVGLAVRAAAAITRARPHTSINPAYDVEDFCALTSSKLHTPDYCF